MTEEREDGLPARKRPAALAVVVVGTVMAVLDSSIANVALPTLAREFGTGIATSIWIVNAYQVAVTMLLIPLSSLGDIVGYRRVYLAGLVVFTLGSLGCALSPSLASLVAFRVLQGAGAAGLMSIAPALNRTIFPARMLGVAVGVSALTVAISSAAGPTVGGAILAVTSWPWLFAVNLPLGAFAIALGVRALPRKRGRGGSFDLAGAALGGGALALLITGLDGFARHVAPQTIAALLVASVILAIAFVREQAPRERPMLPLDLFALPRFSFAVMTSACSFAAQGIALVTLPFLLQTVLGYSAFRSGLAFTAWPLSIALVAPIAGRLSDRIAAPRLATCGLVVLAGGLALLGALPARASMADILWRAAVCGIGFGLFQSPNNREILGSAARERSGAAAGMLASARLTGQSLGTAIAAIALAPPPLAGSFATRIAPAAHGALRLAATVAAFAAVVSALRLTPLGGGAAPNATERR